MGKRVRTKETVYQGREPKEYAGNPNGIVTSVKSSQICRNKLNNDIYMSTGANTKNWRLISSGLKELYNASRIPTGFKVGDGAKAETSFNDATLTFSISPKAPNTQYSVICGGSEIIKTTTETKVITDTTGLIYFYFDNDGVLQCQQDESLLIMTISMFSICGLIYWNSTDGKAYLVSDNERHEAVLPPTTHAYLHGFLGTQYGSGLALTDFTFAGGANEVDWQFRCESGTMYDEDIRLESAEVLQGGLIPVWYLNGTEWVLDTTSDRVKNGVSTRLYYNDSGGQSDVGQNDYVLAFTIKTGDATYPIANIQGQAKYTNLVDLRNNAPNEINNLILNGLPSEEFIFIGAVAYQTNDGYLNTRKARCVQIDGEDYLDYRTEKSIGIRASVTSHSALSNLTTGDDHTQYVRPEGRLDEDQTIQGGLIVRDDICIGGGAECARITIDAEGTDSTQATISTVMHSNVALDGGYITAGRTRGTIVSPDYNVLDDLQGVFGFTCYDGSTTPRLINALASFASENHTALALGSEVRCYVLPNGTTTIRECMKWLNNGDVQFNYDILMKTLNGGDLEITNDGILKIPEQSSVRAFRDTTNQTITNGTETKLVFNAETYDTQDEFNITTGVFTATEAGTYIPDINVWWASSSTGDRQIRLFKNTTKIQDTNMNPASTSQISQHLSDKVELAIGDTLEARVVQTSGGDLAILAGTAFTNFKINKIK